MLVILLLGLTLKRLEFILYRPGAFKVWKLAVCKHLQEATLSGLGVCLRQWHESLDSRFSVTHPCPGASSLAPPSKALSLSPARWSHLASERKVLHSRKTSELSTTWMPRRQSQAPCQQEWGLRSTKGAQRMWRAGRGGGGGKFSHSKQNCSFLSLQSELCSWKIRKETPEAGY